MSDMESKSGMCITEDCFGHCINPMTKNEEKIRRFTITNKNRMSVQIITYGATITSLKVPDIDGRLDDITLGFDNIAGYQSSSNPFIGCTVGRVCSRIGNAKFTLNGKEYKTSVNFFGRHYLHGGVLGFDKMIWSLDKLRPDGIILKLVSPDGHEGLPGEVTAWVTFTLTNDNCFRWCMEATTTKPTPVNMTNHAYFNLAGHAAGRRAMYEHNVLIKSDRFTEFDADTVPTGVITSLKGHPLNCRTLVNVGRGLKPFLPKGYDHNYILDYSPNMVQHQARAMHPPSGRVMDISSNKPCMHFYTSHNMPNVECGECPTIFGKCGAKYSKHGSFCMETSDYPDAVNHPNFPSVILNPGEKYHHICSFKFSLCSGGRY